MDDPTRIALECVSDSRHGANAAAANFRMLAAAGEEWVKVHALALGAALDVLPQLFDDIDFEDVHGRRDELRAALQELSDTLVNFHAAALAADRLGESLARVEQDARTRLHSESGQA